MEKQPQEPEPSKPLPPEIEEMEFPPTEKQMADDDFLNTYGAEDERL